MSLVSCGLKDDDNGALGGTGDKPSINYTNEGTDNYRCYKSTTLKHAGAIVKVVFENPTESEKSKERAPAVFAFFSDKEKEAFFDILHLVRI